METIERVLMLELIQSIHILAAVFILAVLLILHIFSIHVLRWPKAPRPNDAQAEPHYAHLLRKMPF